MMNHSIIFALIAALCCLALADTEVDSFTCEVMNGSYYYDLTPLQNMNDNIFEDLGTRTDFYFAVCRDTFTAQCGGNPACTVDQHGHMAVMGELAFSSWSTEYTAASSGIALVYEHGDNCDEFNKHSTTLVFHCDSTTDFYVYDLSEHYCGVIASIRSRYACPVSQGDHHHHDEDESDSSSGHGSDAWWITLTSIGGAALLCFLLVFVVLAGVCLVKRVRKRSWSSLPQDEEEAGKKWSQEDDIEFGRNSVPVTGQAATVLTPGYVPQGVDTFTSPQYIQTMN